VNGLTVLDPRLRIPTLKGEDVGTSSATTPIASRFAPRRATAERHCRQIVTRDDPAENRTSAPQFGHCAARALKVGRY
jgi:hypothetical protein